MKNCTDLDQSRKLAEFLPIKSADMGWNVFVDNTTRILPIDDWDLSKNSGGNLKFYPAWSLAALLGVLPLGLYDEFDDRDYELEINMIDKMPRYIRLGNIYHSQFPYDFEKDTLLDNVVESIIWLNDNNHFEL